MFSFTLIDPNVHYSLHELVDMSKEFHTALPLILEFQYHALRAQQCLARATDAAWLLHQLETESTHSYCNYFFALDLFAACIGCTTAHSLAVRVCDYLTGSYTDVMIARWRDIRFVEVRKHYSAEWLPCLEVFHACAANTRHPGGECPPHHIVSTTPSAAKTFRSYLQYLFNFYHDEFVSYYFKRVLEVYIFIRPALKRTNRSMTALLPARFMTELSHLRMTNLFCAEQLYTFLYSTNLADVLMPVMVPYDDDGVSTWVYDFPTFTDEQVQSLSIGVFWMHLQRGSVLVEERPYVRQLRGDVVTEFVNGFMELSVLPRNRCEHLKRIVKMLLHNSYEYRTLYPSGYLPVLRSFSNFFYSPLEYVVKYDERDDQWIRECGDFVMQSVQDVRGFV